jgi:ABC-2 type transport system permease protein
MSTIYILWLRQIKRYWRSKSRIIGFLGQPILFLLGFGFGMRGTFAQAGGGDYINFLAPGIVAQAIIYVAVFSGIELIWDKQFGFLKETLVAPVSRFKIIFGRTLGGATIATIQGLLVFGLSLIFGFRPINLYLIPLVLAIMFLIAFLYTALGTAIASTLKDFHGFQLIMTYLVMPSFFLSGALFPLQNTPPALQMIAKINPLTYGVDALRQLLTNITHLGLSLDLMVLFTTTTILLVIASYLFSKIEV